MNERLQVGRTQNAEAFASLRCPRLQRKCACGGNGALTGECEECRKKHLEGTRRELSLQRRALASGTAHEPESVPPIVHEVLRSSGQPLDPATRAFFEPRFGHDFSRVRIHADARAAESARTVNALAYTVGRDVAFASSQYSPGTASGQRLLAHELTHVVQQAGARRRLGEERVEQDRALESEAETAEEAPSRSLSSAPWGILQGKSKGGGGLCGGAWTCAATPCTDPDASSPGDGKAPTSWTLKVMIDIEAPTPEEVGSNTFGHTYVEFADSSGKAFTYGFYPNKAFGTPDPGWKPVVPGCVVHEDTSHKKCVDYTESFPLTKAEYDAALDVAKSLCKAPPAYHVTNWNCTTFAKFIASKAGKTLPPIRGGVGPLKALVADNPNTLVEGLLDRDIGPLRKLTGDTELREQIAKESMATLGKIPVNEKIRVINRLLDGWVSNEDVTGIESLLASVGKAAEMAAIRDAIKPRLSRMSNAGQIARVAAALTRI